LGRETATLGVLDAAGVAMSVKADPRALPDLLRSVVHPWHQDSFGHMNVRHYAPLFDDATWQFWSCVGLPYARMLQEHGLHTVAAETRTRFVRELKAGDPVVVRGRLTRIGTRSVTMALRLHHVDTGAVHATCDTVEVFFDPATRRSAPIPVAVRRILEALLEPENDRPIDMMPQHPDKPRP